MSALQQVLLGYGAAGGGDPYFANVSLLLHMDGTNGSTTFTDNSPNAFTVTPAGNAQITTATAKFNQSAVFDGTGDYLTVPNNTAFDFGSGDFTIECFVYLAGARDTGIINKGSWPSATSSFMLYYGGSGELAMYMSSNGSSWDIGPVLLNSSPTTATWHHAAVARQGTAIRAFFNGVLAGSSATSSAALHSNTKAVYIGSGDAGGHGFGGNIDEVRLTKGVARYTATFTPPAAPFPNS